MLIPLRTTAHVVTQRARDSRGEPSGPGQRFELWSRSGVVGNWRHTDSDGRQGTRVFL